MTNQQAALSVSVHVEHTHKTAKFNPF